MLDTREINEGDAATLWYGGHPSQRGTVTTVRRNADGTARRVGITPESVDHVVWFSPVPEYYALWNATSTVAAYV